uniref:Immunoglobulin V-set domain-containing protein n=1 Tax=Sphaeramia orbicularis TaxID=375764 RepID=A0A673CNC1_9TELE
SASDAHMHLVCSLLLLYCTLLYLPSHSSMLFALFRGSISIPCFYESKYTDNEKYLCKGCKWKICSYEVKTNQYNSTKYLISDDQNQGVVTWTINDLTEEDTDCYWCVMEINQGRDDGNCFIVFVVLIKHVMCVFFYHLCSSSSNHLLSFIIPSCLLILTLNASIWFMLKRRSKSVQNCT